MQAFLNYMTKRILQKFLTFFYKNFITLLNFISVKKQYRYMKKFLTTTNIRGLLTPEELLSGNFGFEKEGLRIDQKGNLSITPHPDVFGNKLKNPYITTDFSESQVEIVTPTFNSLKEAYQCLTFLVDIVNTAIPNDQYIWNQSLPCILPDKYMIPLAEYEGKKGEESRDYRINLAKKYGTKKQMISGIHYNFSIDEKTIQKLYSNYEKEDISYKNFKNEIYLKITRNYLRLKWLIIYLTGATPSAHKTFTKECIDLMKNFDGIDSFYSKEGVSFRNSSIGYKNLLALYPRYDNIRNFINDVKSFIEEGNLSEAKELYTQIRLKPKDPTQYLESLLETGILYLEVRSIDINPFDKCGISLVDAEFVHLFLIYLLLKEESEYEKWQSEGVYNEEIIAEEAFNPDILLLKDGENIKIKEWANEILNDIEELDNIFELKKENIIEIMRERVNNPKKTYSKQLVDIIENKGFIASQTSIAIHNKETSFESIDLETIRNNEKLLDYYTHSLPKIRL